MRNIQEQDKKAFCHLKLFWPFTVWINCSRDLKKNSNCRISKDRSRSLEQFLLTVGQNNFDYRIPIFAEKTNLTLLWMQILQQFKLWHFICIWFFLMNCGHEMEEELFLEPISSLWKMGVFLRGKEDILK